MGNTVKDFLEKVKSTASIAGEAAGRTLDTAGKKASDMWEITRLNLQISDLQHDINKNMQSIGQLVYSAHLDPNTDTDSVDDLLATVDKDQNAIQEINQRINELKQIKICAKCSQKLSRDDRYCRYCGTSME